MRGVLAENTTPPHLASRTTGAVVSCVVVATVDPE
jgi:hypothetical protein